MKLKKIKSIKEIPAFKTEDEEIEFWDTHSIADVEGLEESKIEIYITPSKVAKIHDVNVNIIYSIIDKLKNEGIKFKKMNGRYALSYEQVKLIDSKIKERQLK